jgi:hypothetical protein
MQSTPPKKPPLSVSDLRDTTRNSRQKAMLLGEVMRLRIEEINKTIRALRPRLRGTV